MPSGAQRDPGQGSTRSSPQRSAGQRAQPAAPTKPDVQEVLAVGADIGSVAAPGAGVGLGGAAPDLCVPKEQIVQLLSCTPAATKCACQDPL